MQFRDLNKQYNVLKTEIDKAIFEVLNESNFILGKQVSELETQLANYVGRKYCITCANGTDALILALKAMGVTEGDAVFVPDFTYIATASSVSTVGATPVFVDVDINTFNISVDSLERAINIVKAEGKLNLKAIIAVDLFGCPAEYDKIIPIAKKYNLKVIEDAAQGFGGRINEKKACSFGNISCTSFFPAKPLGCYGDGGAVFTDDIKVDEIIRSLRSNGKSPIDKYDNIMIGMNSRLDTLQAAILLKKFQAFVDYELDNVNKVADEYTKLLENVCITPNVKENFYSSWAQYTILLENYSSRNIIQQLLKENNIPSMIYYPRGMHQQKCFSDINTEKFDFKNTNEIVNRVLSLPIHPYMEYEDVRKVCELIKK